MGKKWAMIFGWIFVVIGVLGFFNVLFGSGAMFHTDTAHNIIHIILGALLLWAAYSAIGKVPMMLKIVGVIYVVLGVLGLVLVSGTGSLLGIAEVNGADNWLHLVLGVVLFWAGWKAGKGGMSMAQATM